MFAGDMGVSPSNPRLQPCDDPVNVRKDIDGPLSAPKGDLVEIQAASQGAIQMQAIRDDDGIIVDLLMQEDICLVG